MKKSDQLLTCILVCFAVLITTGCTPEGKEEAEKEQKHIDALFKEFDYLHRMQSIAGEQDAGLMRRIHEIEKEITEIYATSKNPIPAEMRRIREKQGTTIEQHLAEIFVSRAASIRTDHSTASTVTEIISTPLLLEDEDCDP